MMATPPAQHPSATEPSGFALALRRVAIAVAGLAVAGLAAAACVLSFDDLRTLAVRADARPDLAYLYPATFDALLVIALIGFLLLRTARLIVRLQAGLVLLVLLVAAGLSGVAMAAGMTFDVRQGAIVLAILPWAMLAIGLWLLLLLVKHAQARRAAYDLPAGHARGDAQGDIVPFYGRPDEEEPRRVRAPRGDGGDGGDGKAGEDTGGEIARRARESSQSRGPAAEDASGDATVEPAAEASPTAAPPASALPASARGGAAPAVDDMSGGERPSGRPGADERGTGGHGMEQEALAAAKPAESAVPAVSAVPAESAVSEEPAPAEEARDVRETSSSATEEGTRPDAGPMDVEGPTRPIRWGDLVRGDGDDVLVHPRPAASGGSRSGGGSGEAQEGAQDTPDATSEPPTVPVKAKRPRRQRTARTRASGDEVRPDAEATPEVRPAKGPAAATTASRDDGSGGERTGAGAERMPEEPEEGAAERPLDDGRESGTDSTRAGRDSRRAGTEAPGAGTTGRGDDTEGDGDGRHSDRQEDTQPYPLLRDEPGYPAPELVQAAPSNPVDVSDGPAAEVETGADAVVVAEAEGAAGHGAEEGGESDRDEASVAAPPSGRVRSTPRPPED